MARTQLNLRHIIAKVASATKEQTACRLSRQAVKVLHDALQQLTPEQVELLIKSTNTKDATTPASDTDNLNP